MMLGKYIRNKYKKIFYFISRGIAIILLVTGVSASVVYFGLIPCIPTQRLTIADKQLWVCIAESDYEHTRGLSYTRTMPHNWGMLFVFDEYDRHAFWMKDMNYPIDILWLDNSLAPREAALNVSTESYPGVYKPTFATRFVLETRPGTIHANVRSVHLSPH